MKPIFAAAIVALLLAACGDSGTTTSESEKAPEPVAEEAAKPETPAMEEKAETPEPLDAAKTETPAEAPAAESAAAPEPNAEPEAETQKSARTPSPAGAKVFFISPKDGDVIKGPVPIIFGIEGMEVAKAGTDAPNSGHHHLLIDTKLQDYDSPIPADDQHKHFGGGQTETAIGLPPGKHTLQDVLGDLNHIPHDPPVESEVITITVEE